MKILAHDLIKITLILIFYSEGMSQSQKTFNQSQHSEIEAEKVELGCLSLTRLERTYVINSETEFYSKLNHHKAPFSECHNILSSQIDFAKNTLIGVKLNLSGCRPPDYDIKIYQVGSKIKVIFEFKEYGNCRPLYQIVQWRIIPKVSSDQLVFEIKRYTN